MIAETVPKWLNTPTLLLYWDLASLQLMQLLGPLVTTRQAGGYLDLEGGNRICMVLGLKRLACSRIDLSLCCSASLHLARSEPPDILCESCACIIHTSELKHSTIITSEESLRDSKLPVTGCLRTKGQESVYELCHSHYSTQLATCATSYMCISIVSHFTVMFARGTCASSSSSLVKVQSKSVCITSVAL